ncbi:DNA-binding protein [Listeria monocytogenes]|nr:DNA-binding protein [Listeria monocytogenes]
MYFLDDDDVIKQKISAELNRYVMTQKQVADFLDVSTQGRFSLLRARKVAPFYVFRGVGLLYRCGRP